MINKTNSDISQHILFSINKKKKISNKMFYLIKQTQLCLVGRVFENGLGDQGSVSGGVIPKTLKMVHATSLLNTQNYKVCIKGKVEQSGRRSSALPYTSV